jgi:hypothetical protein
VKIYKVTSQKIIVARKVSRSKHKARKSSKLDKILKQQSRILKGEASLQKETDRVGQLEQQALLEEQKENQEQKIENTELMKLEQLEQDVKKEVAPHPLTRVTSKDIMKGIVGAFVGVVVHFTFMYGVKVAEHITTSPRPAPWFSYSSPF